MTDTAITQWSAARLYTRERLIEWVLAPAKRYSTHLWCMGATFVLTLMLSAVAAAAGGPAVAVARDAGPVVADSAVSVDEVLEKLQSFQHTPLLPYSLLLPHSRHNTARGSSLHYVCFFILQTCAVVYFAIQLTTRHHKSITEIYTKLAVLSQTQDYFEKLVCDFGTLLTDYNAKPAAAPRGIDSDCCAAMQKQVDKMSVGLGSVWTELSKVKWQCGQWQQYHPPSALSSQTTKPPKNILKTNHGAFDLSTPEGRDGWKRTVQANTTPVLPKKPVYYPPPPPKSYANTFKEGSFNRNSSTTNRPTQLYMKPGGGSISASSTDTPPNVRAMINSAKSANTAIADTTATNTTTTNTTNTTEGDTAENANSQQVPPPLTSSDLKAKLKEGEEKQYRRLFIPGRGWMSAKRLQEESELLEQAEKNQSVVVSS